MSRKKKTILDELIAGLGSLLLVVTLFGGYTLFSMFAHGITAQKQINLYSLFPIFIFLLIAFIVCLIIKDQKSIETAKATAISERKAHLAERIKKYRQFYNVSEDTQLYNAGDILSVYPTYTTSHENSIAEKLVKSGLFSANCIFLDSYFKSKTGKTIQIDIIAVGRRGIFIIESKDYSGWIFGNGGQTRWTQTIYKKKSYFYNPIKQNATHVNILKDVIGDNIKYHSLIIFGDDATIKDISYIPKDTYVLSSHRLYEVLSDIGNRAGLMSAEDVLKICRKIHKSRIVPDEKLRSKHIDDIKEQTGENRLYS